MRVRVDPARATVAPGDVLALEVSILNDGPDEILPELAIRGIDPSNVLHIDRGAPLVPGATGVARIEVLIPEVSLGGELPLGIEITADGDDAAAQLVTAALTVGARPPVTVELDPPTVRGRRSGRLETVLHNHSSDPQVLRLDGHGEGVEVRFRDDELSLAPGQTQRVRTRLRRTDGSWFRELRHGALINVRSSGAPVSVPASFVQRPSVPPLLLRLTAIVAIVALWATAIVAVNDRWLNPEETGAEVAAGPSASETDDPGDGSDDGSATGGDDEATDEDGSSSEEADADAEGGAPVVVQGEVTGPADPGGTEVVIERISFGDDGTTDGGTKIAALTPVALPAGRVIEKITSSTDERGRFRFASGLTTGAYYRVTALRPGFEIASAVVQTEDDPTDHDVELDLPSAPGGMSGQVTDTSGRPVGGADVVVTGSGLTYRTTTATDGNVGSWVLDGMAAAPGYDVSVREPRFATASIVRSLDGGQRLSGVDVELVPDLGTIRGRVSFRGDGVGAIEATLDGEDVQRTTTTLTDEGLEGTFFLPALPFGTYSLTFAADGWLTQTTEVTVDRGDVEVLVEDMVPATAQVQGTVVQEVVTGGCVYPDPTERDAVTTGACGGVAVQLSGPNGDFRTTTATGTGTFTLTGVPPGSYSASFRRTGYVPQFLTIELVAGDIIAVPGDQATASGTSARVTAATASIARADEAGSIVLRLVPEAEQGVGELTAVLRDASSPGDVLEPPPGTTITVDGQPDAVVEPQGEGVFRITGLLPGSHTFRVTAPSFDDFDRVLQVRASEPSDGGALLLTPLATLALRLTDGAESPIGGAEIFVTGAVGNDDARLDAYADDGVRACTVALDAAGRWRIGVTNADQTLEGLCATVGADGDVLLRRAVSTGSYRLVTPVNDQDIADDDTDEDARRVRAEAVPLDHLQLDRTVEVQVGETSRLDLRARRYPVIEGRVRIPRANGFVDAGADAFTVDGQDGLASFPQAGTYTEASSGDDLPIGVSLNPQAEGEATTTPPGLEPRISFGVRDGLPRGVYRINRVLPSTADAVRDYTIEFFGQERRAFDYTGSNTLTSLTYGETRTANAVLIPPPVPVDVAVVRQRTNSFPAVENPELTITGTVRFVFESGGLIPIVDTVVYRPGPSGAGRVVDSDDGDAEVRFLAGEPLEISVTAEGFEDLRVEQELVEDEAIQLVMTPIRRDVVGAVQIVPSLASDATRLATITVDIEAVDPDAEAPTTTGIDTRIDGNLLRFTANDVLPGDHRILVSGTNMDDVVSEVIDVPPGPSNVDAEIGPGGPASPAPPFLIDLRVGLDVTVTEVFPAGGSRIAVGGVDVELLLDGDPVVDDDNPATTSGLGVASFTGLLGGPTRSYAVLVERQGYRPVDAGDPQFISDSDAPFTLDDATNPQARELIRFGSADATIVSYLSDDQTPQGLPGASATLLDSSGDPVPDVGVSVSGAGGALALASTLEIPPRSDYQLRVTAPNHDPTTVPVTITDATVTDLGTIRLDQTRGTVSGTVRDATDDDPRPPLPNVRVTATDPTNATIVYAVATTSADGTYALVDLPPTDILLTFEEFDDPSATNPTSRRVRQEQITLSPGESRVVDVDLVREFNAIQGTVLGRNFTSGSASALVGGSVTVTCASPACGTTTQTQPTDTQGDYVFDVLPAGTYDLTFTADGYATIERPGAATVIRFASSSSSQVVDETLTATPLDVAVSVTSLRTELGALGNVRVVATHGSTPAPTTTDDPSYVFDTTTTAGTASLRLPPGAWSIATVGADVETQLPRPHADTAEDVTLSPGVVPDTVLLRPDPYVRVSGTVRSRAHANAADSLLAGATANPLPAAGAAPPAGPYPSAPPTTTTAGTWQVLLPPTSVGDPSTTWTIAVSQADHQPAELDVALAASTGDITLDSSPGNMTLRSTGTLPAARATSDGGVTLTATPITLPVQVISQSDAAALDDVTVTAAWTAAGPPPPTDAAYLAQATTDGVVKQLRLAPGSYDLSTSGASTGAGLPEQPPHLDGTLATGVLAIGATPTQQNVTLQRWASVRGTVATAARAGDTPTPTATAVVTSTQPPTAIPESPSNVDLDRDDPANDPTGHWRVWVPNPIDTTINLAESGFGPQTVTVQTADFTSRDLEVTPQVVLVGAARPVALAVSSSVNGVSIDGVSVRASDPNNVLPDQTVQVSDGKASFTLQPGAWTFSSTDATTLTQPHKDATVARTVNSGGGTQNYNGANGLSLERYAMVTGIVATQNYVGAGSTPRSGVAIAATGATGAIARPTTSGEPGTVGRWRVWLPDPNSVTVTFTLAGHQQLVLPVAAPSSGRDVVFQAQQVLTAIPRTTEVTVFSADGDGALADVDVTATGPAGAPGPFTATTDLNGVARFDGAGAVDRRLAPATWTFTTARAPDATPPHKDLVVADGEDRVVPVGTGALSFGNTSQTAPDARLELDRYASVIGTVARADHATGTATATNAPALTATTTPTGVAIIDPVGVGAVTGAWRIWLPEPMDLTVGFALANHADGSDTVVAADFTNATANAGATTLLAVPRTVDLTVASTVNGASVNGVTVTATGAPGTRTATVATGVATFSGSQALPPATWTFTTSGGPALGPTARPHEDVITTDAESRNVPVGNTAVVVFDQTTGASERLQMTGYAQLTGFVRTRALATQTGTRDGDVDVAKLTPSTAQALPSTADTPAADLGRWTGWVPIGSTDVEFEFRKTLYGTEVLSRTAAVNGDLSGLDVALTLLPVPPTGGSTTTDATTDGATTGGGRRTSAPTTSVVADETTASTLRGVVTTMDGSGAANALVTARSGARLQTVMTGPDGSYTLTGLDPRSTTAVTFSPPAGAPGVPVTRFIAPGGGSLLTVALDQEVPASLGNLTVELAAGVPGDAYTLVLDEQNPFPTLSADGSLTRTGTLGADGTARVSFTSLVPGDDVSIPQDRFGVTISTPGTEPFTTGGIEVRAGATTSVAATLVPLAPPSRDVRLRLSDPLGPIAGATVTLQNDGIRLLATTTPGTDTYDVTAVTAGTWTLVVEGYADASVTIPAGVDLHVSDTIVLTPAPRDVSVTLRDPDGRPITDVSPVLVQGDVSRTPSATVGATSTYRDLPWGTWTVSGVPGYTGATLTVGVGAAGLVTDVTLAPATRIVSLTLLDPDGNPIERGSITMASGDATRTATKTGPGTYTVGDVAVGTWSIVGDGFAAATIDIPAGAEVLEVTVTLVPATAPGPTVEPTTQP